MQVSKEFAAVEGIEEAIDERVSLDDMQLHNNSYILDANHEVVSDIYSGENRIILEYDDIPETLVDLLIATEDRTFRDHPGFDATGIARALMVNLQSDGIEQGASTITQQVARNLYLSHDQTYDRKLTELLYAYEMEQAFDKEEILELYFNSIYFANGVYGIEAAAQYYFNKSTADLSLAEGAFLLAIPNNPAYYNPLNSKERTLLRQERFINNLFDEGGIDEETAIQSKNETIELKTTRKVDDYPDYVSYVYDEFKELVGQSEGYSSRLNSASPEERDRIQEMLNDRVNNLLSDGIIIETALQPSVQETVVSTMNRQLTHNTYQGAFVLIDHQSNEIKAITGGQDYNKFDFHRGHKAFRQPGSAFKPLLVYGPLLDETRLRPSSVIDAGPFERDGYSPVNFGGAVYGKSSILNALTHSYNTAAVRMLDMIGVDKGFQFIEQLGFSRITPADYRLPASLGGLTYGTSVLEMTRAYTVFQRDGVYRPARAIKRVTTIDGEVLYEWADEAHQVFTPDGTRHMKSMLANIVNEGTARPLNLSGYSYVGGKTGTSNDFNDLWFIGSADHYTAGVWVGYDNPKSLESQSNAHLSIWEAVMNALAQNQ
ncbi:transglycosylase domain-containing protein [Salisediminibacterium beveridgei]|nr:transglycosylase domain-containing protein [Salisediminibacterium beveridgei]